MSGRVCCFSRGRRARYLIHSRARPFHWISRVQIIWKCSCENTTGGFHCFSNSMPRICLANLSPNDYFTMHPCSYPAITCHIKWICVVLCCAVLCCAVLCCAVHVQVSRTVRLLEIRAWPDETASAYLQILSEFSSVQFYIRKIHR